MLYYRLGTVLSTEGGSQGARRVHITPSSLAGRSSLARRTGKSGVVAISGDEPHRVLLYLVSACDGGQTAPASDHRSGGRIAAALGSVHGRPTSAGNHLRDNCYVCRGIGCQESQRQVDQCGDDSQAHSHTPANPRSAWSARSATAECSGIARCAAFARWAAAKKIARDQSVFSRGITGNPHGSRCDHAVIRDISDTCVGLVAMCGAHRIQHGAAYWFDTGITLGSFRRLPVGSLTAGRDEDGTAAASLRECRVPLCIAIIARLWRRACIAVEGVPAFAALREAARLEPRAACQSALGIPRDSPDDAQLGCRRQSANRQIDCWSFMRRYAARSLRRSAKHRRSSGLFAAIAGMRLPQVVSATYIRGFGDDETNQAELRENDAKTQRTGLEHLPGPMRRAAACAAGTKGTDGGRNRERSRRLLPCDLSMGGRRIRSSVRVASTNRRDPWVEVASQCIGREITCDKWTKNVQKTIDANRPIVTIAVSREAASGD